MGPFDFNPKHTNGNIDTLSQFPLEDSTMIKASSGGKLEKYGDYVSPSYNTFAWIKTKTGYASEFPDTVEVIKKTLDQAKTIFNENYKNPASNIEELRAIHKTFQKELNLLQGLSKISQVYHKRYQKVSNIDEKKNALTDLDEQIVVYQQIVDSHGELINKWSQSNSEARMAQRLSEPEINDNFSTKEAIANLRAFLDMWCPKINLKTAKELINEGTKLYGKIMAEKITKPEDKRALASLSWFLMANALNKNQGHSRGSFAIEDPKERLYNFLLSANDCGERPSSHYTHRSHPWTGPSAYMMKCSAHHGVDVTTGLLPTEKRHILFGQIDERPTRGDDPTTEKKLLFFKLESFSPFTTAMGYDMTMHGVELAVAKWNQWYHPENDHLPETARESVPRQVFNEFDAILTTLEKGYNDPSHIKDMMRKNGFDFDSARDEATKWGISYMVSFLKALERETNPILLPKELTFDKFSAALNNLSSLDHHDRRTGKEVFLTSEELTNFQPPATT